MFETFNAKISSNVDPLDTIPLFVKEFNNINFLAIVSISNNDV